MKFFQRQPCRALQHLVRFFWCVEDAAPPTLAAETVIPDGCMEMVLHFGVPFRSIHETGRETAHPAGFVGGQIRRSIRIRPAGAVGMLGVRFHPFGAGPLMKLPMDAIAGDTVDITDVFGASGRRIVERIGEAEGVRQRFDIVESSLLRWADAAGAVSPLARAAVAALTKSNGRTRVSELASQFGVSQRTLNRTLRGHVGLGPKSYARILRLQFAIQAMKTRPDQQMTGIAMDAGYFDQAHFIKDFREFLGVSPRVFAARQYALMDSFA